jgi:predicted house-cleaning NTP pyrophosphatase (Maf/HAM1 superfamily)
MYRNTGQAESTRYAQGGYEATFGRYTVDDQAHTFIFHVEGALVRTLVGLDLHRTYAFAGNQLTVGPVNKTEGWRVVWARE